jgi:hypothetical protein
MYGHALHLLDADVFAVIELTFRGAVVVRIVEKAVTLNFNNLATGRKDPAT